MSTTRRAPGSATRAKWCAGARRSPPTWRRSSPTWGPCAVGLETAQVWLIDDTAYETGTWSYTYHPKNQQEQRIGGRYVTLWRRQPDGGWKIWADMGVPGT